MASAVLSSGYATTSPATGTILAAALVVRIGKAATPQPVTLAAVARTRSARNTQEGRRKWDTISSFLQDERFWMARGCGWLRARDEREPRFPLRPGAARSGLSRLQRPGRTRALAHAPGHEC